MTFSFWRISPYYLPSFEGYFPGYTVGPNTLLATRVGPFGVNTVAVSFDDGQTWVNGYIPLAYFDMKTVLEEPDDKSWSTGLKKYILSDLPKFLGYTGGISVGSDPELFAVDEKGVVIPAFSFLPDKASARAPYNSTAGAPYWDGFQAEWNIAPDNCHAHIVDRLRSGIKQFYDAVKAHNSKAAITYKCVLPIPPAMMEETAVKMAAFGCSPSMNAYDEEPLQIEDPKSLLFRFAGCHIHYEYADIVGKKDRIENVVRAIDAFIGPVMTLLLQGLEDPLRRAFYGRAGEYRMPKHGMEYRVPSSAMLVHPIATHIILDTMRAALKWNVYIPHTEWWKGTPEQTRHIINDLDIAEAHRAFDANKELYRQLWGHIYGTAAPQVLDCVEKGIANHVELDMKKNWRLEGTWVSHSDAPNASVCTAKFLQGQRVETSEAAEAKREAYAKAIERNKTATPKAMPIK